MVGILVGIDKELKWGSKISNSLSGGRWMNKNGICKYVRKEKLDEYLSQMWNFGKIK